MDKDTYLRKVQSDYCNIDEIEALGYQDVIEIYSKYYNSAK